MKPHLMNLEQLEKKSVACRRGRVYGTITVVTGIAVMALSTLALTATHYFGRPEILKAYEQESNNLVFLRQEILGAEGTRAYPELGYREEEIKGAIGIDHEKASRLRKVVRGIGSNMDRIAQSEEYDLARASQDRREYSLLLSIFGGLGIALSGAGLSGISERRELRLLPSLERKREEEIRRKMEERHKSKYSRQDM